MIAGILNLLFKADTKQASKGMKKLSKDSSNLTMDLKDMGSGMAGFSLRLAKGLGIAGGAIGALTVATSGNIRETQRWADSLGIPAKRLEALRLVGAKYGIDAERMADATKDLNERVADAASGAPAMVEAFKAMGLEAKDLIDLRADEQLFKVADAIEGMGSAGAQSFRAMELMADAGFDLLPLIRDNGKNFKKMTEEIEGSGFALSNLQRGSLLTLNNSFSNLTATVGQLIAKVASGLSPVLSKIFDSLSSKSAGFMESIKSIGINLYREFKGYVKIMAEVFSPWYVIISGLIDSVKPLLNVLYEGFKFVVTFARRAFSEIGRLLIPVGKTIGAILEVALAPFQWLADGISAMNKLAGKREKETVEARVGDEVDGIFAKIEGGFGDIFSKTDKAMAEKLKLDLKDKTTGGLLNESPNATPAKSSSLVARQVNPNRIRLGGNSGLAIQNKQLSAQKKIALHTAYLADMMKRSNIMRTQSSVGGIGAGVSL